jgi:osmotically-inducible protein OsmY
MITDAQVYNEFTHQSRASPPHRVTIPLRIASDQVKEKLEEVKMRKLTLIVFATLLALTSAVFQVKATTTEPQIRAEIQDRLYHASVFKHGNVQATYDNGVVTLAGSVDSLALKNAAAKSVHKVKQVSQVVNNITINTSDITDRQIALNARKQVVLYPFFTIFDWVTFKSQDHHLTVSGYVTDPFKKTDIGRLMEQVKGATQVNNDIEVLPTSRFDDQVRLAVARAIYRDPFFRGLGDQALPPIHIIVKNMNVTLYGVINSKVERARAETDARFATTYFSLTNRLQVENS